MLLPHRTDHRGYVLLGWRVTLSGTALDASGAKVQRNNQIKEKRQRKTPPFNS